MIHGVAIPKARTSRTTNASTSAPEKKRGTARERSRTTRSNREAPNSPSLTRDSVAKADLAGPGSDLRELGVVLVDADVVGRSCDVLDDGVANIRAAADLLECLHVQVCYVADVVFRPRRDPDRDGVRELGEPADVADRERLAERQRPDDHPGGLAHRRRAETDYDVAGGEVAPERRLVEMLEPEHALLDCLVEL